MEIQSFEFTEEQPVMGIYGLSDDVCIRQLGFITCLNVTNTDTEVDD